MKNEYILGACLNVLFLIGTVLIYQLAFRELVVHFTHMKFLGEPWFFGLESLVLPFVFFLRSRRKLGFGALAGTALYCLIVPLAFIYGD